MSEAPQGPSGDVDERLATAGIQSLEVEAARTVSISFTSRTESRRGSSYCIGDGVVVAHEDGDGPVTQTNGECIFNLLNNNLGVSMLAVGYAYSKVGLGLGMMLYAVCAYINRYTINMIYAACQISDESVSYPDIARVCFGRFGYGVVSGFIFFQCQCAMTAYLITISVVLASSSEDVSKLHMCIVGIMILSPFTFLRSMKKVAVISAVATAAAISQVALIAIPSFLEFASGTPVAHLKKEPEPWKWCCPLAELPTAIITVLPLAVMAFANQNAAPMVLASLQDNSFQNVKHVTRVTYVSVLLITMVIGSAVYLRYTNLATDNALETLGRTWTAQLARLSGSILMCLSFIFNMVPCRGVVMLIILGKDEVRQEASFLEFAVVTLLLNVQICLLAMVATKMGGLSVCLRLSGGVCCILLALIFPPLMFGSVRAGGCSLWQAQLRARCGNFGELGLLMILGVSVFLICNTKLVIDLLEGSA